MAASMRIQLVVGLGNPGADYVLTRHNAGFWFVDALARSHGVSFKPERKFSGDVCRLKMGDYELRLLKPDTFMNRSGHSVQATAAYLKLPPEVILVAHDDLDLPAGSVRLKQGGGHGGHNGLRDIIDHLGENFCRLRFGIGRPPPGEEVIDYVLKRAGAEEQTLIMDAITAATAAMSQIVNGEMEKAMHALHSRGVVPRERRSEPSADIPDIRKGKS
jgi:peptidyl-tRNA hydrolase, PTH1 family